ncbi:MAG: hypothetical protein JWO52_3329 [Gammaproteobacteria bacterium]|nr:hypothetical protein [Gammaproteobacteria bacterium]
MINILPGMTVQMLAEILEANKGRDVEAYIRVESIRGKPCAFLVREPRIPVSNSPALLLRQGE